MTKLETFRQEKDGFWKTGQESPLTEEQKSSFTALKYFPENASLVFELEVKPIEDQESIVQIQTSAGDTQAYRRSGKITFPVSGKDVELAVFRGIDDQHTFLPFRDTTNGSETYGSGRYVEAEENSGKIKVDFNYAYNPYCAYNENFRCPLTPSENKLSVPIEAGEKKFHD